MVDFPRHEVRFFPRLQRACGIADAKRACSMQRNASQDIPGFIINRLQYAMLREALYLVDAGIGSVEDVDRAVQRTLAPRWAAMGPMKLMDFAGLDTVEKVAGILLPALDNSDSLPAWLKQKVADNQLGVKSGEGFYPWTPETADAAMRKRDETVKGLTAGSAADE